MQEEGSALLTSQRALHGGLHEPREELEALRVLGEAAAEGGEGVRVPPHVLQRDPLPVVGLEESNVRVNQGLLYHRTCKHDLLCSWPSLNSYLK